MYKNDTIKIHRSGAACPNKSDLNWLVGFIYLKTIRFKEFVPINLLEAYCAGCFSVAFAATGP